MIEEKKINLLFDASIISINFDLKNSGRSGIFWVAYNILKEMNKRKNLNIKLFDINYNYKRLEEFLNESGFENCEIIKNNSKIFSILSNLIYIKYNSRKTNDKKTQTVFMMLKRTFVKIFILFLKYIYEKTPSKKTFDKTLIENFNIYFSPVYKAPDFIFKCKKIKKYTMVYDLIPTIMPGYHPKAINSSWYTDLLNSINKNDYYFAISENTRQDFIKNIKNINPDKIITTLLAANENFYQNKDKEKNIEVRKKYNIPVDKKYILSLCTLEPRKNLVFAIKSFIELIKKHNIDDLVLVLSGGHWNTFIGNLNKEIENFGLYKDKIIKTGYIKDDDLASLYSNALMFVYPSLYEGFGLPPLEAMQCGCPVITSNVSSLPEVVGNVGIMINPQKNSELIEAYEKLYFDEELREELSQKSLNRATDFCWEKCVDIIIAEISKK